MKSLSVLSILLLFFIGLAAPSWAQFPNEEIIPEGARGRLSQEPAQVFALRRIQGEVVETDAWRDEGRYYHEYTIMRPDGSVFKVDINALNGEVFDIEVEVVAVDFLPPPGLVDRKYAQDVALAYAADKGKGVFKGQVQDSTLMSYERHLVYGVRIKKGVRSYQVFIDAFTGAALEMEEVK